MKEEQQSIPPQYEGKQIDLEAKSTFDSESAAKEFYLTAKSKLLRAFEWYNIAKIPAATFILTDYQGNEILREMRENDILRIDIPGPGTSSGTGYDWVRVDKIVEGATEVGEYCTITLRPTSNPTHQDEEIAHFFKSVATSTLLVKRENLDVIAEYHGRNEVVNAETAKLTDKIRNIVVGFAAKLGLSFSQWKSLIEGLVEKKENK
jgi:hypothetical protein